MPASDRESSVTRPTWTLTATVSASHATPIPRQTPFHRCPSPRSRPRTRAAHTPKTSGALNAGSMMKMVDQPTGRSENGRNTCVPYTVKQSSSGWVTRARKASSNHPCRCGRVAGWMRTAAQATSGATRVRRKKEWLYPRCQVKAETGSAYGHSTSRSGASPQMPPHRGARQPALRPRTASPTAAPRATWVKESTGRDQSAVCSPEPPPPGSRSRSSITWPQSRFAAR